MTQQTIKIQRSVLHSGDASKLVEQSVKFNSGVWIEKDGHRVNAKSLLGVICLDLAANAEITVQAEGKDETAAVLNLTNYFLQKV